MTAKAKKNKWLMCTVVCLLHDNKLYKLKKEIIFIKKT